MENSENVTPTKARKCSITIEVKITPSPKKKKEPQLDIEKALSQMFDNFGDSMANKLSEGNVCEKSKVNTLEVEMKSNKDLLALLQDSPCGKKPEVNEKVVEGKKKKRNLHSLSMSELMHSTPTKKSYEETDEELLSCLDFVFGSPVSQKKGPKKKHSEDDGNDNIEKTVKKNKKQKKINNQMEQDKTEVLDNSLSLDEGVYTENEGSVLSQKVRKKKKHKHLEEEYNTRNEQEETIVSSDYSHMNALENKHVTIRKKKKCKNVNDDGASLNVTEDSDNQTIIKKKTKKTDDESVLSTDYSIQDENISVCDYTVTKKSKSKMKAKLKTDNQAVESPAEMSHSIIDKKKSSSAADENEHKEHDETILSSDYSHMNELENNHVTIKKKKKRKNVNDVSASLNVTKDSDNETTIKKKRKKTDDESVLSTDYSIQDENISVCDDTVTEKSKSKKKSKMKSASAADKKGKNEHNSDHNKENVESQDFPTSHTDLSLTKESSTREQDTDSDDADVTTLRVRKAKSKNSNNVATKFKKILSKHKCESVKTRPNRVVPRRRKFAVALDSKQPQEQENGETKTAPIEEAPDKSFEELLDDVEDKDVKSRRKYKDMAKLNIFVPYPIPALHRIETRVAGRPTNAQKQQIEDLGVSVKSGNFSQAEDKILRKNWRRFCKMHNMPRDPTPFLNFADVSGRVTIPTIERINFVRFLAHGLENRLLSSVYRRFKRINCNKEQKTGNYTPEEDKVIIDYIQTSSSETPYADLAKLLNRSRISVHKRCTSLGERLENSTRVKWDEVMIEKFIKELKRVTKVEELSEFKDRKITNEEWNTLAERLNLPKTKLQRGWTVTVYPKLFIEKNMKLPSVKKELVALLIERGEKDWRTVNWQEITKSFEGFSALRLNRIMKDLVSYHCPVEIQNNLGASLEYVKDIVNKELKTPLRTTYLKKIQLE